MAAPLQSEHLQPKKIPSKCFVYWDYENCPIPRNSSLSNVIAVLKERIWKILNIEIPFEIKLYISTDKISTKLQQEFDINGVKHYQIASRKPESVDKRILVDIPLDLYEWIKYKQNNVIILLSGDKDFGHLLSRIHKLPEIYQIILVLFDQKHQINLNLLNNIDHIINKWNSNQFISCPLNDCSSNKCVFYHPKCGNIHQYYPNYKKRKRSRNNKHKHKHNHYYDYQSNRNNSKRRRLNHNNNNNNNASNNDDETDSSVIELDYIPASQKAVTNNNNNNNNMNRSDDADDEHDDDDDDDDDDDIEILEVRIGNNSNNSNNSNDNSEIELNKPPPLIADNDVIYNNIPQSPGIMHAQKLNDNQNAENEKKIEKNNDNIHILNDKNNEKLIEKNDHDKITAVTNTNNDKDKDKQIDNGNDKVDDIAKANSKDDKQDDDKNANKNVSNNKDNLQSNTNTINVNSDMSLETQEKSVNVNGQSIDKQSDDNSDLIDLT